MPTVTPQGQPSSTITATTTNHAPAPVAAAPVEAPKAQEVKPQDDAKFVELARREKMIYAESKRIAAEKKAWELEKSKASQAPQVDNSWKEKLKADPLGLLAEANMTYEDLLNTLATQDPNSAQFRQVSAKIQAIEDNQKKIMSQYEDSQKASYEQAKKQISVDVGQLIKSSPEEYELLGANGDGAKEAVVKYVEDMFNQHGYLMDIEEAAKDVENHMLEESLKLAKLKKVQARLTPTQAAAQAEVAIPKVQESKGPTTLTHSMSAPSKPMTTKERYQRAILIASGKLTS